MASSINISIRDYNLPMGTYKYDVEFFSDVIDTTVTKDPTVASEWISGVMSNYDSSPIVGLDVEWRPKLGPGPQNPVATLQLCSGKRCLIYQLIHSAQIPYALFRFLSDRYFTFVGVGIGEDLMKLWNDYGIMGGPRRMVELARVAAEAYGRPAWINQIGLKDLAWHVLRKEVEKPRSVTLSQWDQERLTEEQVQYACIDAFVSSEIGKALNASTYYYSTPI